jgi:hypothetical protein
MTPTASLPMYNLPVAGRRPAQDNLPDSSIRHHDAGPHPLRSSSFPTNKRVRLQEDQKESKGARAELDRDPVGEQLPWAQQHAEMPRGPMVRILLPPADSQSLSRSRF